LASTQIRTGQNAIKVGFCVAYDWYLLKTSVPLVYPWTDLICISIDKERRGWSGKKYEFDEIKFREFIRLIDIEKKIDVYEANFALPELTTIVNDNRQRQLMAKRMGSGGWHIQIDSDEYFLDFRAFAEYLKKLIRMPNGKEKPINVMCNWISIIKKTSNGLLLVDNSKTDWETMPFATNCPEYSNARRNSHFNHRSPFFVVHDTWARDDKQLREKLDSWGHSDDFVDKEGYFSFWKSLSENNYKTIKDFHPLQPKVWHELLFVESSDINDLISKIKKSKFYKISKLKLYFQNSRNFSRLVRIWNLIFVKEDS
jgi:hypothetical protein